MRLENFHIKGRLKFSDGRAIVPYSPHSMETVLPLWQAGFIGNTL
ncbi:hypothetical protein l13_16160 [Neisseria weaveri ATCC 51223]|nr:hypothetical protein l13_16160 [Neisseria weaveri ATCC 51223]